MQRCRRPSLAQLQAQADQALGIYFPSAAGKPAKGTLTRSAMTQLDTCVASFEDLGVSPSLDDSLLKPKLDTTVIFDDCNGGHGSVEQAQSCALLALLSVNSASAPSAEVPWSQVLALSLVEEEDPPVLTVGRHKDCNLQLADARVSLRHFEVYARRGKRQDGVCGTGAASAHDVSSYEYVLHDSSSNGTTVNGKTVGKGNTERLRTGDEICVLPANRVGRDNMIAFVFRNTAELLSAGPHFKPVPEEQLALPTPRRAQAQSLELEELVVCPICMEAIYKCVAIMPCFHNFCMTCFSDWMRRKDDCPVCRRRVAALMKNHPMEAVIEAYLEANPDRRRPPEVLRDMDARDELKLGAGGKVVLDKFWQGAVLSAPNPRAPVEPVAAVPLRPPGEGHEARAAAMRGRASARARAPSPAADSELRWAHPVRQGRPPARSGSQVCALQ